MGADAKLEIALGYGEQMQHVEDASGKNDADCSSRARSMNRRTVTQAITQ
jgi:hypothetical protein